MSGGGAHDMGGPPGRLVRVTALPARTPAAPEWGVRWRHSLESTDAGFRASAGFALASTPP